LSALSSAAEVSKTSSRITVEEMDLHMQWSLEALMGLALSYVVSLQNRASTSVSYPETKTKLIKSYEN
jgi:hypothetical protein